MHVNVTVNGKYKIDFYFVELIQFRVIANTKDYKITNNIESKKKEIIKGNGSSTIN